jgi:hypothetical protein
MCSVQGISKPDGSWEDSVKHARILIKRFQEHCQVPEQEAFVLAEKLINIIGEDKYDFNHENMTKMYYLTNSFGRIVAHYMLEKTGDHWEFVMGLGPGSVRL